MAGGLCPTFTPYIQSSEMMGVFRQKNGALCSTRSIAGFAIQADAPAAGPAVRAERLRRVLWGSLPLVAHVGRCGQFAYVGIELNLL